MICVAEDERGLRQAASELMEESYDASERAQAEAAIERSGDPEAARLPAGTQRTLSPGYYLWLGFIAQTLEQELEAGVSIDERAIGADELLALEVLREARAEFRLAHPPCGGCSKLLRNPWDKLCNDCQRAQAAGRAERS